MAATLAVKPDFQTFKKKYPHTPQIVYSTIVSDLETPVSVYLKIAEEQANSFLLESVEGGEVLGRYSIIGLEPDLIWQANSGKAAISTPVGSPFVDEDKPILESFEALLKNSSIDIPDDLVPMAAGLFGYFGYDLVREVEKLVRPNRQDNPDIDQTPIDVPDAIYMRPTIVAVFDNIKQTLTFATPIRSNDDLDAEQAYEMAVKRLEKTIHKLSSATVHKSAISNTQITPKSFPPPQSNTPQHHFYKMVNAAKDYIRSGDIFQVVLSQRFSIAFQKKPFALYRSLRRENPSPFLFFFNFEHHALVGSSPEILVRVRDNEVTVRPIAGTRPRSADIKKDKEFEAELLADPKECAEHLMLLDLGRNDVGRSAEIGSVKVTDQFMIERYSHVMHIVSNVVGKLRRGISPVKAVMNGFPAGTVSGAPKVRAMEIIDALEPTTRGAYAGSIGYFSAGGNVDTAITLRTGLVKDGTLYVQAGAGIVADSDPEAEHNECMNKAKALFAAAAKS